MSEQAQDQPGSGESCSCSSEWAPPCLDRPRGPKALHTARIRSRVVPTIWDNSSWEIVGALRRLRRSLLSECERAATASSPDAVCSPPSLDGKRRELIGNERAHPELLG